MDKSPVRFPAGFHLDDCGVNQGFGIFARFAELVDKVAGATTTWCNAGSEIRKRLRPRRRIQSSQSYGRPEGSRRMGDKSSVCTPCSPRSSLLRVSCLVTGQNRYRPEKRRLVL